ncbi:MAG: hypothetical protein ACU0BF_09240 [Paracoccaceae bacterium]
MMELIQYLVAIVRENDGTLSDWGADILGGLSWLLALALLVVGAGVLS